MAGKNQVTLTFAGDAKPLEGTVDQVEGSTKRMGAGFAICASACASTPAYLLFLKDHDPLDPLPGL